MKTVSEIINLLKVVESFKVILKILIELLKGASIIKKV